MGIYTTKADGSRLLALAVLDQAAKDLTDKKEKERVTAREFFASGYWEWWSDCGGILPECYAREKPEVLDIIRQK